MRSRAGQSRRYRIIHVPDEGNFVPKRGSGACMGRINTGRALLDLIIVFLKIYNDVRGDTVINCDFSVNPAVLEMSNFPDFARC